MKTVHPSMTNTNDKPASPQTSYFANTRTEMAEFVPEWSKTILECGCGEGVFGALIKGKHDAEVWGIEINPAAAERARKALDKVIEGDIGLQIENVPDGYFDCIVFNDVLEHLLDPWAVLTTARQKLSQNGVLVCSIPNIRFFRLFRDYVLRGEWHYEDVGVCDRTHLHCFTAKSIRAMFGGVGYDIVSLAGINGITTWKFGLLNALTFGWLADTRYPQFACVAKPK
ncbi:MAG TPA: class I SAM-dependent methyltransferase [Candidatus Hydrogenedentes bacterium]|nr:class I SAM-dependent methyltransferase [Candidatus Hydrogenedentota bacterium]